MKLALLTIAAAVLPAIAPTYTGRLFGSRDEAEAIAAAHSRINPDWSYRPARAGGSWVVEVRTGNGHYLCDL